LIEAVGADLCKIGRVSHVGLLAKRLRSLQTGCPHDLRIVAHRSAICSDERRLHVALASKQVRGEWFSLTADVASTFEAVAE
jgi:hypothetical protein